VGSSISYILRAAMVLGFADSATEVHTFSDS
jgi:hypothetical protein